MNLNVIYEDFERKYSGAFVQVYFKDKNIKDVFRITGVSRGENNFPTLELKSDKYGTVLLNYNTNAQIIFNVPKPSYCQIDNEAYYISKSAQRQWKRGLHPNNVSIIPGSHLTNTGGLNVSLNLNYKTARAAFNPKYLTVAEALDLLKKDKDANSCALSRNIAISKSNTKDKYHILYRYATVGTMDANTGQITSKLFAKEIRNEIK